MEPMRLWRELRIKNLEAFMIKRGFFGETICWVLLVDHQRPSTLDDFPYLKGIEDEKDFGRSNFIRVIILHAHPIDDVKEEIISIVGCGFVENKDSCHWNTVFEKIESQESDAMEKSRLIMLECFERIVKRYGLAVHLTDIAEDRFNYLSQD